MKALYCGVFATLIAISGLAQPQSANKQVGDRDKLIGAWHLAQIEAPGPDGKPMAIPQPIGMLIYTRDGHMSVQVMYRNPPMGTTAAPVQYAQGGYEASFGTYEIDESTYTFTFHVEGALVRTLIGKDLPRAFELSGKQLTVKSTHLEEHWRVAWEHY